MKFMPSWGSRKSAPDWPDLAEIDYATKRLRGRIVATPTLDLTQAALKPIFPDGARISIKLELFQQAGSFKARGALLSVDALSDAARESGITAASGGNHALAVSWAAAAAGVSARVHMPRATDPARLNGCRDLGAEITLHDDIAAAFAAMQRDVEAGLSAIHPFEGRPMTLGAATCGYEITNARPDLDAIIVPVGGGGLISGVARAVKLFANGCEVIGVEPEGADSITRSRASGAPVTLDRVDTVADSLGAPYAMPYSFGLIEEHVDDMVTLPDSALIDAMVTMRDQLKLVAEPACAASFAALTGPLRERFAGKNVAIIACGSNISSARFESITARG